MKSISFFFFFGVPKVVAHIGEKFEKQTQQWRKSGFLSCGQEEQSLCLHSSDHRQRDTSKSLQVIIFLLLFLQHFLYCRDTEDIKYISKMCETM